MWPDDETPEPAAWINFNAATGERNVSFVCESELASIPLWPEPHLNQSNMDEKETPPVAPLAPPAPPADDNDFPLGKACDLSDDGSCEACQ